MLNVAALFLKLIYRFMGENDFSLSLFTYNMYNYGNKRFGIEKIGGYSMTEKHFIITGTSRGIGEQLAMMLLEGDSYVHGISRGNSDILCKYSNYSHINYDLSNTLGAQHMLNGIINSINTNDVEMLCLINNAAMLEPLKSIEKCTQKEINENLQISLIAPMVLTSCFIQQTESLHMRRKIINISSGSGTYPALDMSVYCTAKAGINMFTECVGAEQNKRENAIEVIAVDPGMVDTELQRIARGKEETDFGMAALFNLAHETGQLQSTRDFGERLLHLIDQKMESGKIVTYSGR